VFSLCFAASVGDKILSCLPEELRRLLIQNPSVANTEKLFTLADMKVVVDKVMADLAREITQEFEQILEDLQQGI